MLYSLYTSPLGDIDRLHDMYFHFYADDTQLYLSFETSSFDDMVSSKAKLEACVHDIDSWMPINKLKNYWFFLRPIFLDHYLVS